MTFLKYALGGLVVGVANIIPGVSGGTMAVVLGIYDRLIEAISTLRTDFKRSLFTLVPVAIGAGTGILLFSSLVKLLLERYPTPTNFFFLGLILGGMPLIYRRALAGKFRPYHLLPAAVGFGVLMLTAFVLGRFAVGGMITTLSLANAVRLFFSGALAAACMILPGISGSMILVVLGVHSSILTAISGFNMAVLIPTGLGILLGLLLGAKVIDLCLRKFPQGTYLTILGMVIGSLVPVFLNAQFRFNTQGFIALGALVVGCLLALGMTRLERWLDARTKAK